MSGKKRKSRLTGALMALLGAACALILCAVFYGTMVYQLADRTDGAQAKQAEPAKTLALGSGEMEGESRERVQMGGKLCDVLTRTYLLADGTRAQAITASPAAYIGLAGAARHGLRHRRNGRGIRAQRGKRDALREGRRNGLHDYRAGGRADPVRARRGRRNEMTHTSLGAARRGLFYLNFFGCWN